MGDSGHASRPNGPHHDLLLKAKEVFLFALALPASGREAYLQEACGGDPELRSLVDSLLRSSDATLGLEAIASGTRSAIDAVLGDSPGTVIGPYILVKQIGEGGFGTVFLAEQAKPVKRTVAIKILKPGMDSRQIVARFELERQALALMDHPSIAKVFDAGTTTHGRPYFVMEHCTGVAVTKYCDLHKLRVAERLELFVQVCDAIQHAHQRGVIHRDIKPHNVLVDKVDGRAVAKVIDFGIAKATQQRLTEGTLLTELHQLVGTPEYMSPEQAEGTLDIDTRTDVYSLGVLLYELLTGTTPFDSGVLRRAAIAEIHRIIREVDPPSPSVRLRSVDLPLGTIADERSTPRAALLSTIRGDLDWVVMKAIDKDRSRRYDSAGAMATDIRRHMHGMAVDAAPPSAMYVARKFVRRNRVPVIAAALVAISVVAGLVGTLIGFVNAEQGRREAVREKTRADGNASEALLQARIAERQAYLANIGGAIEAIDIGQIKRARERLAACKVDQRGWEWDYASQMTDSSIRWFHGGTSPGLVSGDIDCSPAPSNNTFVTPWREAASGRDGACIYDGKSGLPVVVMQGHTGRVNSARFSADGSKVVTASDDGTVRVFSAATGEQIASFSMAPLAASVATFDVAAARVIAIASSQERVYVFDLATGLITASIGDASFYTAAAFPADPRIVLTRGFDGPLVWDPARTGPEALARIGTYWTVCNRALPSPDGHRIAVNSPDQTARILDAATGRIETSMRGHTGILNSFSFDKSGALLATSSEDSTVRVWDTVTGDQKRLLLGHRGFVRAVDFSSDGSKLYSAGDDGVRVWNVSAEDSGEFLFTSNTTGLADIGFTPDGACITLVDEVHGTRLIDAETLLPVRLIDASPATRCSITPDGQFIVIAGYDDHVRVFDLPSGDCVAMLPEVDGICRIAVSPDGARIAVSSWNQAGTLYDLHTGRLIATLEGFEKRCSGFVFSPDSLELIASTEGTHMRRWRSADGLRLDDSPVPSGRFRTLCFTPDGRLLSAGQAITPPMLWDPSTGQLVREFRGHDGFLSGAAMFPDGSRLVSCARDGTVRLWDPGTGEEIAVLRTDRPFCDGMAISPDGSTIAVVFEDTGAQFFRTGRAGRR